MEPKTRYYKKYWHPQFSKTQLISKLLSTINMKGSFQIISDTDKRLHKNGSKKIDGHLKHWLHLIFLHETLE